MGELKPCCANSENRSDPQPTDKPELTVTTCKVCGCRHFLLNIVDPLAVVGEGGSL